MSLTATRHLLHQRLTPEPPLIEHGPASCGVIRLIIDGLNRSIVARVPKKHRRDVRIMHAAVGQMYETAMQSGEAQAYNDGLKAAQQREAESQESGFQVGYRHGLDRVMGEVGSPARRVDEDKMTPPVY